MDVSYHSFGRVKLNTLETKGAKSDWKAGKLKSYTLLIYFRWIILTTTCLTRTWVGLTKEHNLIGRKKI